MPRGDKGAIMRYAVPDVPLDIQTGVADTLSALDARIAENRKTNHHLAACSRSKKIGVRTRSRGGENQPVRENLVKQQPIPFDMAFTKIFQIAA